MTNRKLSLGVFILLCIAFGCTRSDTTQPTPGGSPVAQSATPAPSPCPADASWITAPNPPTEIGGPNVPLNSETNCQFYQFAYQWFFSMVQPAGSGDERKFETLNLFQPNMKNQCAANKLTGRANIAKVLFVRTQKPATNDFNPVLPQDIKQASGDVALYDRKGNVVLYNVFYNELECQATTTGFKPNTIEIKTSWRILENADPAYYTITATVQGFPNNPLTLGLVGFHLVINTQLHPEFVWASFEHVNNAPDCTNPQSRPAAGWSFLSDDCAKCLHEKGISGCSQCNFNTPATGTPGLTGTPTNVCRVYRDGTDPEPTTGGNNNDTNRFNIDTLNKQIATLLPSSGPMAVWKNYTLVAGLWTNGGVASGTTDAQRGSLEAANTTMETFVQSGANKANCFSCHGYNPSTPLTVSHIVSDLLPSGIAPKRASETK